MSLLLCAIICSAAPVAHAASDFVAPGAVMAQQQQQQRQQKNNRESPTPALAPAPSRSKGFARSARGREGGVGGGGPGGATRRSPPPSLEVIRGSVRVSDGDTIEITTAAAATSDDNSKKEKIRLWGVDAPESKQTCKLSSSSSSSSSNGVGGGGGEEYPCGERATAKLRELFGLEGSEGGDSERKEKKKKNSDAAKSATTTATCEVKARDQYGRAVARCFPGDVGDAEIESIDKESENEGDDRKKNPVDVGLEMVRSGNAVAYRQFSKGFYDEAERAARDGSRGIWGGTFEAPEDWRREQRIKMLEGVQQKRAAPPTPGPLPSNKGAASSSPSPSPSLSRSPRRNEEQNKNNNEEEESHKPGCDIKGNISGDGSRRYHLPSSSASYGAVKIDARRGERWFCSEDEARAAGWQRARDGGRPAASASSTSSSAPSTKKDQKEEEKREEGEEGLAGADAGADAAVAAADEEQGGD